MFYELKQTFKRREYTENQYLPKTRQQQALRVLPLAVCSFDFSQESLGTAQLMWASQCPTVQLQEAQSCPKAIRGKAAV